MIHATLGAAADRVVVTSTKSMTGHLLGGAGALESIATVLALHDRVVPPTINLDDRDPKVDLDIATKPRDLPQGDIAAMNNSFGFGGAQRGRRVRIPLVTTAPTAPQGVREKPAKPPREVDPRNPNRRLAALFDAGTLRADHPRRRQRHARRRRQGGRHPRGRLLLRRDRDGRRDGRGRLQAHRARLRARAGRPGPDRRALALRRRPAGRGGAVAARGRRDLPRHDAGLRQGPADLGGARPGGRRRGVRPGAHRHRDPRARGPDLRHRSRRGPLGHRRGRRHAAAGRPRAARPPLRRRAHRHRERAGGARPRPRRWPRCSARRARSTSTRSRTSTSSQLLPESKKRAYDVHPLVEAILDEGTAQELHAKWAPNIVTTLGRLGGRTVGVIANNPLRLGGCLDSLSAEKAARFVRMCDAFGVPLVVLVDVPGYLPGVGPGVGRRRTPRRQAAARLRRGGRPAGHAGDPQDLRRRLHRDELPLARRHQGVRLARAPRWR